MPHPDDRRSAGGDIRGGRSSTPLSDDVLGRKLHGLHHRSLVTLGRPRPPPALGVGELGGPRLVEGLEDPIDDVGAVEPPAVEVGGIERRRAVGAAVDVPADPTRRRERVVAIVPRRPRRPAALYADRQAIESLRFFCAQSRR